MKYIYKNRGFVLTRKGNRIQILGKPKSRRKNSSETTQEPDSFLKLKECRTSVQPEFKKKRVKIFWLTLIDLIYLFFVIPESKISKRNGVNELHFSTNQVIHSCSTFVHNTLFKLFVSFVRQLFFDLRKLNLGLVFLAKLR